MNEIDCADKILIAVQQCCSDIRNRYEAKYTEGANNDRQTHQKKKKKNVLLKLFWLKKFMLVSTKSMIGMCTVVSPMEHIKFFLFLSFCGLFVVV